jgi:hypothetical protein
MTELLRREKESVEEVLKFQEDAQAEAAQCEECELLVSAVITAMLRTRALLSERKRAADAGLIDDMNFLNVDAELDQAFAEREAARDAYVRHRQERHGGTAG